jgi:hypothetical protein
VLYGAGLRPKDGLRCLLERTGARTLDCIWLTDPTKPTRPTPTTTPDCCCRRRPLREPAAEKVRTTVLMSLTPSAAAVARWILPRRSSVISESLYGSWKERMGTTRADVVLAVVVVPDFAPDVVCEDVDTGGSCTVLVVGEGVDGVDSGPELIDPVLLSVEILFVGAFGVAAMLDVWPVYSGEADSIPAMDVEVIMVVEDDGGIREEYVVCDVGIVLECWFESTVWLTGDVHIAEKFEEKGGGVVADIVNPVIITGSVITAVTDREGYLNENIKLQGNLMFRFQFYAFVKKFCSF